MENRNIEENGNFNQKCRVVLNRLSNHHMDMFCNIKGAFERQVVVIVDRLPQCQLNDMVHRTSNISHLNEENSLDSTSESLLSKLSNVQPFVRIERINLHNSSVMEPKPTLKVSISSSSPNDARSDISYESSSEFSDTWETNFVSWSNDTWEYPDLSFDYWQDVSQSNGHQVNDNEHMSSAESIISDGYNSTPEDLPAHFDDPLEFQGFRELFVILRNFNNFEFQSETFGG